MFTPYHAKVTEAGLRWVVMRRFLVGGVAALVCALSGCHSAEITHCETVDCPKEMVCDGLGGCATPEQLAQCAGQADGNQCSYATLSRVHVEGSCDTGVCRSLQIPACLEDLFLDSRVDAGTWELWLPENQPVSVVEEAGQLGVVLAPNVGRVYNGIQSRGRYDMIDGHVRVLVQPASQEVGVETNFSVEVDSSAGFEMSAYAERLHLVVHTSGGVSNSIAIDYDPIQHAWWRIRHDAAAGTMELETSPDGEAWTSRRSSTVSRLPTSVIVSLLSGTYIDRGVADPGVAYFDSLKLTSATCP
jgi:hypothetical protein